MAEYKDGDHIQKRAAHSVCFPEETDECKEGWQTFLEVRELLEKFSAAYKQHAELLRLKSPHKKNLTVFRNWLDQNTFCATLTEFDQWFGENDEHAEDLVTIYGGYEYVDAGTRWEPDIELGAIQIGDEAQVLRVTKVVSIVTSAVLPASSMLVLYFVNSVVSKLVIIILYNIGFSIIIGVLANAWRVEIFAASMAFAAVLVAFITNID
ncbi:hypothetical protein BJX62DRAFT_233685 [Aspergillus germanicus]